MSRKVLSPSRLLASSCCYNMMMMMMMVMMTNTIEEMGIGLWGCVLWG